MDKEQLEEMVTYDLVEILDGQYVPYLKDPERLPRVFENPDETDHALADYRARRGVWEYAMVPLRLDPPQYEPAPEDPTLSERMTAIGLRKLFAKKSVFEDRPVG